MVCWKFPAKRREQAGTSFRWNQDIFTRKKGLSPSGKGTSVQINQTWTLSGISIYWAHWRTGPGLGNKGCWSSGNIGNISRCFIYRFRRSVLSRHGEESNPFVSISCKTSIVAISYSSLHSLHQQCSKYLVILLNEKTNDCHQTG